MTRYLIDQETVEELRSDLGVVARESIEVGLTIYGDRVRELMSRLTQAPAAVPIRELNEGWTAEITVMHNGAHQTVTLGVTAAAVVRAALGISDYAPGYDWSALVSPEDPHDHDGQWSIPLTAEVLAELVLNGRRWSKTVTIGGFDFTVDVDYSDF